MTAVDFITDMLKCIPFEVQEYMGLVPPELPGAWSLYVTQYAQQCSTEVRAMHYGSAVLTRTKVHAIIIMRESAVVPKRTERNA